MAKIWEEANLAGLLLNNRVVRSATNENMAVDGLVGQQLAELYRALGEGGVGLLITGHMYVSKDVGRASPKPVSYTHLDVYKRQGSYGRCC